MYRSNRGDSYTTGSFIIAIAILMSCWWALTVDANAAGGWTENWEDQYQFELVKEVTHLPVEAQGRTGTCWSFAMTSFFEAEIARITGKPVDLSEMYVVRTTYLDKAWTTIMRQGQVPFNEGSLNPDPIHSAERYGLVPQSVFDGLIDDDAGHDHRKLHRELSAVVKSYSSRQLTDGGWREKVQQTLDEFLGTVPSSFIWEGKEQSPSSFMQETGIQLSDYRHVTSFTHRPFYREMILDIPDNFSNERFQNVPLDEFVLIVEHALDHGFSLAIELDVNEPGFLRGQGLAIVPAEGVTIEQASEAPSPELEITQEQRQEDYERFRSSNDHNVHLVGKVVDSQGKRYYKVKNSWSSRSGREGYFYMSEAYLRSKVFYLTLHRDGIPPSIVEKMESHP